MVLAAMQAAEGSSLPDRFLAKVGGKLISVRAAFAPAWSAEFFWALDMPNKLWWGANVLITPEMAESARFLQAALGLFNGTPIWLTHASILFRWDASGKVGWGAAVWTHPENSEPTARAGGYWENGMLLNSPCKRQRGAGLLTGNASPSHALAGADGASTGRQSHSERGNSRVPRIDVVTMLSPFRTDVHVVRKIWFLSIEMGVSLLPVEYVNTKDNDVADQESREPDPDDWAITDSAWELIESRFGPHDWDRFASMENRRCERYTAKRY